MEAVETIGSLSDVIDSTEIANLRLSVAVPTPVTTTSESCCVLLISCTFITESVVIFTSLATKPMKENLSVPFSGTDRA